MRCTCKVRSEILGVNYTIFPRYFMHYTAFKRSDVTYHTCARYCVAMGVQHHAVKMRRQLPPVLAMPMH